MKTFIWIGEFPEVSELNCDAGLIIGNYDIRVILDENRRDMIEIIRCLNDALGNDIEEIVVKTGKELILYCYIGQGDFVFKLEDIYKYKNEIEKYVKNKIAKYNIDYELIISVSNFGC